MPGAGGTISPVERAPVEPGTWPSPLYFGRMIMPGKGAMLASVIVSPALTIQSRLKSGPGAQAPPPSGPRWFQSLMNPSELNGEPV